MRCAHRKSSICAVLALLALAGCGTYGQGDSITHLEIHAHRGGAALRPENTIRAFQVAIQNVGVDAVELDVHQTADRKLIVNHNYTINPSLCLDPQGRTIINPPVISNMTFAQVRAYDCGTLVGLPAHTPLATLDEVFANTSSLTTPTGILPEYDIHVKWDHVTIDAATYASLLLTSIRGQGVLPRVHLMVESPLLLAAARSQEPNLRLFYLVNKVNATVLQDASGFQVEAIAPIGKTLSSSDVTAVHQLGIKVIPWTVNLPMAWVSLSSMGVDGIITDNPLGLKELIEGNSDPLDLASGMPLSD